MPRATESSIQKWRTVLSNAHKQRLDSTEIEHAITGLAVIARASSDEIVEVVLSLRSGDQYDKDPLVIRYVDVLLRTRCILPSSLLLGLLQKTQFAQESAQAALPTLPLPTFEEKAFHLVRVVLDDKLVLSSAWKLHGLVFALTRWLSTVSDHEMAQQLGLGPLHTVSTSTAGMYEALAMLVYTMFGNRFFKEIERQPWWKTRRSLIVAEIIRFDLNVLQPSQSQLSGWLQKLTLARPFLEIDKKGKPMFSREQILAMPEALPTVQSRGGLLIWLSSMLSAQVYVDDSSFRNYLLVRYHDDPQTATVAIIMAAFDVLVNSAPGQGTPQLQKAVRSFICNRLPLLICSLATLMPSGGIESCISMVLASIELGPVTPLGTTTAEIKEMVNKAKVEFLQACVVHSLLTASSIAAILPGTSASKVTRYNRATLLSQCTANITRLDSLVQELDTMSGNAGAIAGCIADLITSLCTNRDTMTLKSACAILLKRISSLEVIFQFVSVASFTSSLRIVLDGWIHDQDQTEFQPAYEEFAVILLFLNTIVHVSAMPTTRSSLSQEELFTTRFLSSGANTSETGLTDEQDRQLSSWVQGLFTTDDHGDPVGITDEVYSQCPPQAFYLLVPVLFEQTAIACKLKAISTNTMQGGLEFLLEPFLLPALIPGLRWIADTSWTDVESTNVRIHMLEKLLKSSSTSQEVQTLHKAILTIVAQPLEASLQTLLQARPDKKKEVTKILEILKPYTARNTPRAEPAAWRSAEGGMLESLRLNISKLSTWSTSGNPSTASKWSPTLVKQAISILGPVEVLQAIIIEVVQHTNGSNGSLAIDLCTAIICEPSRTTQPGLALNGIDVNDLNLRDCLRLFIADEQALLQMPSKQAEAAVRLSRSVEAQLALSPLASQLDLVALALPAGETTDQVMQDLGLTATDASLNAAAAAAVLAPSLDANFASTAFGLTDDTTLDLAKASTDSMLQDSMSLDGGHDIFGDLGMDLAGSSLLGANTAIGDQGMATNAEDDIFADLDMGDLGEDFNF